MQELRSFHRKILVPISRICLNSLVNYDKYSLNSSLHPQKLLIPRYTGLMNFLSFFSKFPKHLNVPDIVLGNVTT